MFTHLRAMHTLSDFQRSPKTSDQKYLYRLFATKIDTD